MYIYIEREGGGDDADDGDDGADEGGGGVVGGDDDAESFNIYIHISPSVCLLTGWLPFVCVLTCTSTRFPCLD